MLANDWNKIKIKGKGDDKRKNQFLLDVGCGKDFQVEMNRVERDPVHNSFGLILKHARIFKEKIKTKTVYFKADGHCSICGVKYYLVIESEPKETDTYISINVQRTGNHSTESKRNGRNPVKDKINDRFIVSGNAASDFVNILASEGTVTNSCISFKSFTHLFLFLRA
jgi:hypothetical protein